MDLDLLQVPVGEHHPDMRMHRPLYEVTEGCAVLARARVVHLAMLSATGDPILRAFDSVVDDGFLAFVSAGSAGEALEGTGRTVVIGASETIVILPSAFVGPCRPAPTFFVRVQAEGTLQTVDDPARKRRVVAALLEKYQGETETGRWTARDALEGWNVAQVRLDRVRCVAKLGQDWRPDERRKVIDELWKRGAPGDVEAIGTLLARFPELGAPEFLRLPENVPDRTLRLQCALGDDEIEEALELLEGLYWLVGLTRAAIRSAVRSSTARVAARDNTGRIVAFARAVSDGKCAWVYDVAVAPHLRGCQLGSALMRVLLDHPALRGVRHVRLTTKDAMPFYRRLGFQPLDEAPRYPWTSTEMIRSGAGAVSRESEPSDETKTGVAVPDERHDERPRQAS